MRKQRELDVNFIKELSRGIEITYEGKLFRKFTESKERNFYVSSCANVISESKKTGSVKYLNQQTESAGYKRLMFNRKNVFIHRLVAFAFMPFVEGKEFINHIDENTSNNHVSNLEWVTQKENQNHGGYQKRMAKTMSKVKDFKYILVTNKKTRFHKEYDTQMELVKELGLDNGNVCRCLDESHYSKSVKGYKISYVK